MQRSVGDTALVLRSARHHKRLWTCVLLCFPYSGLCRELSRTIRISRAADFAIDCGLGLECYCKRCYPSVCIVHLARTPFAVFFSREQCAQIDLLDR